MKIFGKTICCPADPCRTLWVQAQSVMTCITIPSGMFPLNLVYVRRPLATPHLEG